MQRLLLIVLALAAVPAARADCSQATQDQAVACMRALATPSSTVLAGCVLSVSGSNVTWNRNCTNVFWCPYFDAYTACMPPECCSLADQVNRSQDTLDASQLAANTSCSARVCASGMVSAASGASLALAATTAALLAALVASRW